MLNVCHFELQSNNTGSLPVPDGTVLKSNMILFCIFENQLHVWSSSTSIIVLKLQLQFQMSDIYDYLAYTQAIKDQTQIDILP